MRQIQSEAISMLQTRAVELSQTARDMDDHEYIEYQSPTTIESAETQYNRAKKIQSIGLMYLCWYD